LVAGHCNLLHLEVDNNYQWFTLKTRTIQLVRSAQCSYQWRKVRKYVLQKQDAMLKADIW